QSGPRHTIPLTDCLGNIDIMRHIFQAAPTAAPRPGGSHWCTRAAAHRWDTAPDGPLHAAHTASASPDPRGPPWAVARAPCGRRRGPRRAYADTAHRTAPRASEALGHGGATAAESPPRAMSSVGARQPPHRPPPAVRDR